jgi:hypothetical protein
MAVSEYMYVFRYVAPHGLNGWWGKYADQYDDSE